MISWRTHSSNLVMFLLLSTLFFAPNNVKAAPALDDSISITQPDGTSLQVRINGDEFQNWQEDVVSGLTVVRNPKDGYWEYAEKMQDGSLQGSGMRVDPNGQAVPAHIPPHLRPPRNQQLENSQQELLKSIYQERFLGNEKSLADDVSADFAVGDWTPVPVAGTRKVLVILVNFANRSLITTAATWHSSVFSTTAGVKSVSNYFKDNSYSKLSVTPVAHTQNGGTNPGVVTVTVANSHPNNGGTFNFNLEIAWVNQALAQANPFVNFAALDTNANGILDRSEVSIYFIPAGYDASGTAKTPSIWAHATSGTNLTSIEGKTIITYAMNGELNDASRKHPIGVIAHELGHSLCGLPDLYDTSGYNGGLGHFSLMAGGSWGYNIGEDSGTTPTVLDAWSRQYLGWAQPQTTTGTVSLHNALYSGTSAIKLINPSVSSSEYFLAENRYPIGWDLGLKGRLGSGWTGGLLVTHIDITIGTVGSNDINKYGVGAHQGVSPEQASTVDCNMLTTSCRGIATTLFYSGNNSSFTDATSPNARFYSGAASGFGLTTISVPGSIMNLTVTNPAASTVCAIPATISVPTADADGVYTVSWGASSTTGVSYQLQEATNSTFTTGLRTISTGTARTYAVTGRSQNVTYYYRVRAIKTGLTSSGWRTAASGCAVPGTVLAGIPASITVPVSDPDGVYTVSWGASATAGVTYELQESSASNFTTGLRTAYRGTALSTSITGRSQNVTYYYRVRAVKSGLKDSGYRTKPVGCAVPGAATAGVPASITVPASDPDGAYPVSWGASATAGVNYELQEATNNTFTAELRLVYRGTARTCNVTGRVLGKTYYYRVRAVKGGLKDSGYRTGGNGCALSNTSTLAGALDTSYSVTTSGNANWRYQTAVSYYGGDAAQSGVISASQSSLMQTTVTLASSATVSFYWKVSSESGFDKLIFNVDGTDVAAISGEVAWTPRSFALAAGTHILKWTYSKDGSVNSGSDAGWVDKLVVTAGTNTTLAGVWNLSFDWGCSGVSSPAIWTLGSDNRYTDDYGGAGSWSYNGTKFTANYDNGTVYTSTGTVTSTHMEGSMLGYEGSPGCWSANKSLSAVVAESIQHGPESVKAPDGTLK